MWSDTLTGKEVEYTERAIKELNDISWARPVLDRLHQAGGMKSENMPLMFEVRFAYELHLAGKKAEYEYRAGVGNSTVEFYIQGEVSWLIELVSIRTSKAAKEAIKKTGLQYKQVFYTNSENNKQSEEAEMILAEQKIGEKVFSGKSPTKFPVPKNKVYHVIFVDMRGYLDKGGDIFDYRQMAFGVPGIPPDYSWTIHYWKSNKSKFSPIQGLFEKTCPLKAAPLIQKRIHFLGFVSEQEYKEKEIACRSYYMPNSQLMTDIEARIIFDEFPLKHIRK